MLVTAKIMRSRELMADLDKKILINIRNHPRNDRMECELFVIGQRAEYRPA